MTPSGKNVYEIVETCRKFEGNVPKFVVINVFANGLAPLYVKPSADTEMT